MRNATHKKTGEKWRRFLRKEEQEEEVARETNEEGQMKEHSCALSFRGHLDIDGHGGK